MDNNVSPIMASILENMSDLYEAGLFNAQEHSSKGTCVRQIPAAFKKINWEPDTINLDYGGGCYWDTTEYLFDLGVANIVIDPYNRPPEHNRLSIEMLTSTRLADTATICNVLNVIKEHIVRLGVLFRVKCLVLPGATVYISCYRGNGTTPTLTSRGWQENRPLKTYLDEVKEIFPDAEIKNGMIIAKN